MPPAWAAKCPSNEGVGAVRCQLGLEAVRRLDDVHQDEASAGIDQGGGDVDSPAQLFLPTRRSGFRSRAAVAPSEYGGIAWPMPGLHELPLAGAYGYGTWQELG